MKVSARQEHELLTGCRNPCVEGDSTWCTVSPNALSLRTRCGAPTSSKRGDGAASTMRVGGGMVIRWSRSRIRRVRDWDALAPCALSPTRLTGSAIRTTPGGCDTETPVRRGSLSAGMMTSATRGLTHGQFGSTAEHPNTSALTASDRRGTGHMTGSAPVSGLSWRETERPRFLTRLTPRCTRHAARGVTTSSTTSGDF
jgi:hypothetical protein